MRALDRNDGADPAVIVEFDVGRIGDLIAMWRSSFETGVGIADPHSVAEQREYFLTKVLSRNDVRFALVGEELVGFIAASTESIAQLYVRVGFQRRGIGAQLLAWAKGQSSGALWLFTFARNYAACAFYERNGFVAVAHGFEPVLQLEDVKYQWSAGGQIAV